MTPSATPSVLHPASMKSGGTRVKGDHRCHLFMRNGKLVFLGDYTHDLAGQTVPMEPF